MPEQPLPTLPLDTPPKDPHREQARTQFENAWKAWQGSTRPTLEFWLIEADGPLRKALLAELLRMELNYRRLAGERPAPADYLPRFPEEAEVIHSVFADAEESSANGLPGVHEAPTVGLPAARGENRTAVNGGPSRFRRLRPLARGGLGEVSVALDGELKREVALKEIQAAYADHPEVRARFLKEAEVTGRLEHPGVVPVYALEQDVDGRPYYAMRLIHGESLTVALRRLHEARPPFQFQGESSVPLRGLLFRFVVVCHTVAYAHSRGVIHRDLKPDNVMLGPYGETLVIDWGLAKLLNWSPSVAEGAAPLLLADLGNDAETTQAGAVLGTPAYMSPEQAEGRQELIGPASDVYSLGAILYTLLTGRAPYVGNDLGTLLQQIRAVRLTPPRAVRQDVPEELEAICLKAMAPRYAGRYAGPGQLAADVERWLAGPEETTTGLPWPFSLLTRRGVRMAFWVVLALVVLLIAGWTFLSRGVAPPPSRGEKPETREKKDPPDRRAAKEAEKAQKQEDVGKDGGKEEGSVPSSTETVPSTDMTLVRIEPRTPMDCRIAVQSDKVVYGVDGPIAIVLDCSGSMNERARGKDRRTRFEKAKWALNEVLKRLPNGAQVSLRYFVGKDDRSSDIRLLWDREKWNKSNLKELMNEVDRIKPMGRTPLVRAAWEAIKDLPSSGPRTMLVLTDGADNYFHENYVKEYGPDLRAMIGPKKTIEAFMRQEFGASGIRLRVIGFEVSEEEKKEPAYEDFKKGVKAVKGEFYEVEDAAALAETLRRSLLSYYWVEPDAAGGFVRRTREGQNISRPPDKPRWLAKTAPGFHRVSVAADASLRQRVELDSGDSLLLDLTDGPDGRLALRRSLYADSSLVRAFRGYRRVEKAEDGWCLSVLQNGKAANGDLLEIMASLEKDEGVARRTQTIRQVRPRWVWFEVNRTGNNAPLPKLRVRPLPGYPAPAWGLEMKDWPADTPATLSVWWWRSNQDLPEAGRLEREAFRKPLINEPWRIEGDPGKFTVESMRVEEINDLGGRKVQGLVVHLRHPRGTAPYSVRLLDWKGGEEHRFYANIGKYTAIFYPMTEKQAREQTALLLMSVSAFKKHPLTLHRRLDLGVPGNNRRPPAP